MSNSDSQVEVKIVGKVDGSVAASASAAKAQIASLADVNQTLGQSLQEQATAWTAQRAAAAAATQELEQVEQAADATGHAMGRSRAATESLVIVHEALSGRLSRIPGSMMILAQAATSLSGGMLMASAAVAGLAAGLAYLAYQELEAEKNLDHLAEGFKLTGRGADMSREAVAYNLEFLAKLPGSTNAASQGFMALAARHADWSAALTNSVGQLMPAFIDLYGKEAPEALGKLTETLSNLSVEGFQRLDRETLNLSPAQHQTIENLIRTGNEAQATSLILQELSQASGIYIKSYGDQVYDLEQKIDKLKSTMNAAELKGIGDTVDIQRLKNLEAALAAVRAQETKGAADQHNNQYKDQLDAAQKLNQELDKRGTILSEITKLQNDLDQAEKRSDSTGASTFTAAIANEQAKLKAMDDEADKKRQSAIDEANRKRIAAARATGEELIQQARDDISAINADESLGGAERVAKIKEVYEEILATDKLTSQQRRQIIADENNATAAANRAAAQQQREIDKDNIDTTLRLAKIGFDTQREMLEQQVAENKITKRQELQELISISEEETKAQLAAITAAERGEAEGTLAFIQNENRKKVAAAEGAAEIAKLRAELASASKRDLQQDVLSWKTADNEILSAEDRLVQGIFSGRSNLWQSAGLMVERFAEQEIAADLKAATQHILLSQEELAADKTAAQGGFLWKELFAAQSAASDASSATADAATAKASAAMEIPAYTGEAAMGAAAAVADIPIVGPELAAAAFAEMEGLGGTAMGMASFDVGTPNVSADQIAQVHKGEIIVPADFAQGIRSGDLTLGGAGQDGASNGGPSLSIGNLHLHGLSGDPQTVGRKVVSAIYQQWRAGNPTLAGMTMSP